MFPRFIVLIRWAARLTGVGLVGVLVAFAVGHGGLPDLSKAPAPVRAEFAALALIVAGCLLGWRWEAVGGAVVVFGYIAFNVAELVTNGTFAGGLIPLLVIPGLLYLMAAWLHHIRPQHSILSISPE